MSWKDIIKVDLREARTLGRKHAPEEMAEGKERVTNEKELASHLFKQSASFLYGLRRGNSKNVEQMKNSFNHSGFKVDKVEVKPQVSRDRGDYANAVLQDPYPHEDAIITITSNGQKFSFALTPMVKDYSSVLRRPKTKSVKGGHRQRNVNQHIGFDRKEDV